MTARQVRARAATWLESGGAGDALKQRVALEEPITIHGPECELAGWFVGVTSGERLVGFLQFNRVATLMRYSTFQRRPGSLDGCPAARSWLDPATIKSQVRGHVPPGTRLGQPILTYDRNPTRLAWAVRATIHKHTHTIFVAGDFVFEADEEG